MENLDSERGTSFRPGWWDDHHTSGWDRVKEAFHRDWEQTKADFSKKHGKELNQNAADTVKQATGADPVPPENKPTPKPNKGMKTDKRDWTATEPAARYGFGARSKYGMEHKVWDDKLETKLRTEWDAFKTDRKWDEAKRDVRAGWDFSPNDDTRSTH